MYSRMIPEGELEYWLSRHPLPHRRTSFHKGCPAEGRMGTADGFPNKAPAMGKGDGLERLGSTHRSLRSGVCSVQLARTAKFHDIVLIDLIRFLQCPILTLQICETEAKD
jgi:hypothetical protein